MAIPFLPRRDDDAALDEPTTTGQERELEGSFDLSDEAVAAAETGPEPDPPADTVADTDDIAEPDSASAAMDVLMDGPSTSPVASGFSLGLGDPAAARSDAPDPIDASTNRDVDNHDHARAPQTVAGMDDEKPEEPTTQAPFGPTLPVPNAVVSDAQPATTIDAADSPATDDANHTVATPTHERQETVTSAGEPAATPAQGPDARDADVVPELGSDHVGQLLGNRHRDVLRPGGGQQVARPARVIAMANQKGGVGKTTTTINLGAALAELGSRVLLIDIDPQGSLGVGLGADPHARTRTVYNLLLVDGTTIDDVLVETNVENLHLLPANIDLAAAELLLVQEVAREQALRRVVERVQYRYDFILIDCPPSLGLLTINGLTAADAVIVPLEAEYFALRGMSLLMQTLEKVQARLNPQLKLEGIVATMFDGRTLHAREVIERVRSAFGDVVYKTMINKTIRFAEAPVAGEPILTYRPRSKGSDAYRDLAKEVLAREPSS